MATRRELKVYIQRRGGIDRDAMVEKTVRHVVGQVFSTRLANTIRITVKLRATELSARVNGVAKFNTFENPKSKHYTIVVDRDLPWPKMRETIAHEIQHVHQFATGRLRFGRRAGVSGWFWREGAGPAKFFPTDSDYWTRPWEVEARAAESLGNLECRKAS